MKSPEQIAELFRRLRFARTLRLEELRTDIARGLDSPDGGPLDVAGMKARLRREVGVKRKQRRV